MIYGMKNCRAENKIDKSDFISMDDEILNSIQTLKKDYSETYISGEEWTVEVAADKNTIHIVYFCLNLLYINFISC